MKLFRHPVFLVLAALLLATGCATRPVNPSIAEVSLRKGYRFETRPLIAAGHETLVVLAFSGGGTRAAAFSYGVLEKLRRTKHVGSTGGQSRWLDSVDIITGVSGGSFTALAYGLYGEKLFDEFERRFLKRDVQGALITRILDPSNWGALASTGYGRSDLAAKYYDDILFNGATFADLTRGHGPFINITATDLSTGARVPFSQTLFDVMCSDLDAVPLSRAAAASSAVPVVLSAVTLNNYGGTCGASRPAWLQKFDDPATMPRPAARVAAWLNQLESYSDSVNRPYVHLVDGGVSDNVGLRGAMDLFQAYAAAHMLGGQTPLDHVRRIVIFVVNSQPAPSIDWDKSENPPGMVATLMAAAGAPIDHNSEESVEGLKDIAANWSLLRRIRNSPAFAVKKDPALGVVINAPNIELHVIDVSFRTMKNKAEAKYLENLPTSFVLSDEAVDRLRAAAGKIIEESAEFQRLQNERQNGH